MATMMRCQPAEPRAGDSGNAMSSIVGFVLGTQPAVVASVADRAAELDEAAEILLAHRSPVARRVGGIIKHCLAKGGDLNQSLGLKVKRGGAHDVPATQRRLRDRNDALRALAATLSGKPTARANAIAAMLLARDCRVTVIHESTEPVPTSTSQLKRILRGA